MTSKKAIKSSSKQPSWASRLGFIMTAAGASVGLGNLERFPQLVAEHGGGAFLILYLLCVVLFGWPLMLVEMSLGRATKTDPINAFVVARGRSTRWKYVGVLGLLVAFAILSYYVVACSWTLAFMCTSLFTSGRTFVDVASQPLYVLPLLVLFHLLVTLIVLRGFNRGVEKFSMIVMPLLFVIQLLLIGKMLMLKDSWRGVLYYLQPDVTRLRSDSFFVALSQAFFSLCIGEAVLLTYGSYASDKQSLPTTAGYIACLDTIVAFLGGFIIIPAMLVTGQDPAQGTGLVHNTLSAIFSQMAGGSFFMVLYFVILAIAGLTTCISLLDITSSALSKHMALSKKRAVLLVSMSSFVCSLPSLYAKGGCAWLSEMHFWGRKGFYAMMDFAWGSIAMLVCGLLMTIFVGWVWGDEAASKDLSKQACFFSSIKALWRFHVRWLAPTVMLGLLLGLVCWGT